MWAYTQPALRKDLISYPGNVGSVTKKPHGDKHLDPQIPMDPVFIVLYAIVLYVSKGVYQELKIFSKVLY